MGLPNSGAMLRAPTDTKQFQVMAAEIYPAAESSRGSHANLQSRNLSTKSAISGHYGRRSFQTRTSLYRGLSFRYPSTDSGLGRMSLLNIPVYNSSTESGVEQKFLFPLLTHPSFLAIPAKAILTKKSMGALSFVEK